jgi:hypothetical protein
VNRRLTAARFGSEWRATGLNGATPPGPQPRWRIRQAARVRELRRRTTAHMTPVRRFLHEEMEDAWVEETNRVVLYGDGTGNLTGILNHPGITPVSR